MGDRACGCHYVIIENSFWLAEPAFDVIGPQWHELKCGDNNSRNFQKFGCLSHRCYDKMYKWSKKFNDKTNNFHEI